MERRRAAKGQMENLRERCSRKRMRRTASVRIQMQEASMRTDSMAAERLSILPWP